MVTVGMLGVVGGLAGRDDCFQTSAGAKVRGEEDMRKA